MKGNEQANSMWSAAMDSPLLNGTDRIEMWDAIGRQFRMGSPTDLRVSNMDRLRSAIASRDVAKSVAYFNYIHGLDSVMVSLTSEWALRWPQVIADHAPRENVVEITVRANELWRATIPARTETSDVVARFIQTSVSEAANGANIRPDPSGLLLQLNGAYEAARQVITQEGSLPLLENYLSVARDLHDLISQYLWVYPTVVIKELGEGIAQQTVMSSFNACSFQDQMWKLFASLSPLERTAFLAEHMRAHFSGPRREGEVEVVEESDHYRIICNPCGSGGAMRRSTWGNSMGFFTSSSPMTWNKSGKVPAYCAHCAVNQINSTKFAGYPLWVTEFNPDDSKPCCWTVFKSKELIPSEHFI